MTNEEITVNVLMLIAGSVVTYFVSKHYYKTATKDLNEVANKLLVETQELKKEGKDLKNGNKQLSVIITAVASVLENPGIRFTFKRDEDNIITGHTIAHLEVRETLNATDIVDAVVVKGPGTTGTITGG